MSNQNRTQRLPQNIQNLNEDEIKHLIVKNGLWPPYSRRIKNLEKVEDKLWRLFTQEYNLQSKLKILEDIANLQPLISKCYSSAKEIIEFDVQRNSN